MRKQGLVLVLLVLSISSFRLLTGCRKTMHTRGLTPASLIIPADFPTPLHTYQDNPLSKEGMVYH